MKLWHKSVFGTLNAHWWKCGANEATPPVCPFTILLCSRHRGAEVDLCPGSEWHGFHVPVRKLPIKGDDFFHTPPSFDRFIQCVHPSHLDPNGIEKPVQHCCWQHSGGLLNPQNQGCHGWKFLETLNCQEIFANVEYIVYFSDYHGIMSFKSAHSVLSCTPKWRRGIQWLSEPPELVDVLLCWWVWDL